MGRKRTHLALTLAQQTELMDLLKSNCDRRRRERLKFLTQAATGQHTLEELADLTGRSRSTIQNWLEKYFAGGIAGLLEREAPPGRTSPLATPRIQRQLATALKSGRVKTAAEVAAWLHEKHGLRRARKSIYYWLRAHAEAQPAGASDAPARRAATKA